MNGQINTFKNIILFLTYALKTPLNHIFSALFLLILFIYYMYINMFSSLEIQYQPVKER